MWTTRQYRQLTRASGWYDLVVTAAFVTPWTFAAVYGWLGQWSLSLGLEAPPAFEPIHGLMANLMGSIVCVWSVLRIRDPQQAFGRYDAVGRGLFATWQLYALSQGASPLIAVIMFFELAWGIAQSLPVRDRPAARLATA